ncbi:MAG: LON peptidase substrate-binding domain-containing protein, partial [Clostridia bacterium]|nr:LON peptidase substrate-binding domain-containing protein [Clostridia bacterium]
MSVKKPRQKILPTIVLRGIVPFPETTTGFDIGRPQSLAALNAALEAGREVFLITQRSMDEDYPPIEELRHIGCVAKISQMLKLHEGTVKVVVEPIYRAVAVSKNVSGREDLLVLD